MEHQATLAKLMSTKDKIDVPKEFWESLQSVAGGVGEINKMLLMFSKEMNQMFLFPVKQSDHKIIKIFCELEELSMSFVQEITEETIDFELEKIHVTGVTTNDDGSLIFEGYYSCSDVDINHLIKNISSHDDVSSCTVEYVD